MERLDKILAAAGAGSRSDVKAVIRAGRVKVNGSTVKDPQQKISEEDAVMLDGKALNTSKFRYYMLNKPCGLISSTKEEAGGAGTVTGLFQNEGINRIVFGLVHNQRLHDLIAGFTKITVAAL